jgi:hypothetical protein
MVQLKGFRFIERAIVVAHLLEAISKLNNLKLFVLGIYMNLMVLLNPQMVEFL